jgi:hypothetical protein
MISKNAFRVIVLAAFASALLGVALNVWAGMAAMPGGQSFWTDTEQTPLSGEDVAALVVAASGWLLALVATAGFCLFWRPARVLAVIATILLLVGEVFVHPLMHTTIAHVFGDAAAIFWGMALAFSFCPPFSESFERRRGHA